MCKVCDRVQKVSQMTSAEARDVLLEATRQVSGEHLDVVIDAVLAKTPPPEG